MVKRAAKRPESRRRKGQLSEADRRRCVKQSKSFEQQLVVSREEYKWCYNSQQAAKTIDEEMDKERSCEELRGSFERNETNDTALVKTHNRIDALAIVVQGVMVEAGNCYCGGGCELWERDLSLLSRLLCVEVNFSLKVWHTVSRATGKSPFGHHGHKGGTYQ